MLKIHHSGVSAVILLVLALSFNANSSVGTAYYKAVPFKDNLRIMHFSNAFSTLYPRPYNSRRNLISSEGVNVYPIVGSDKIIEIYGSNKYKQDIKDGEMIGGMHNLRKLVEIKRNEVGFENNLLFDIGGSLSDGIYYSDDLYKAVVGGHIDMSIDGMSLGHEVTLGRAHIEKIAKDYEGSNITILSTNIRDKQGFFFNPYKEYKINNKNIVVLGISYFTSSIPREKYDTISNRMELDNLTKMVDYFAEDTDLIILLSSNTLEENIKLAKKVPGLNMILGGSDSMILPHPVGVETDDGITLVSTSGSNGNFLSVFDIDLSTKSIENYRYKLSLVYPEIVSEQTYGYNFYYKDYKPNSINLVKVVENMGTGGLHTGDLDRYFLQVLKRIEKADVAISQPSMHNMLIKAGEYITEDDIDRYFNMISHRSEEIFITGEDLSKQVNGYYKSKVLSRPSGTSNMGMRSSGLEYTIDLGNKLNIITIQKVNGIKFSPSKRYKVVGWGDVFKEDPSRPFVESVIKDYLNTKDIAKIKIEAANINIK